MIKFFKDSFREIRHVVWPTKEETKKYFLIIIVVLILFWAYVSLAWTLFSETIFYVKDLINNSF